MAEKSTTVRISLFLALAMIGGSACLTGRAQGTSDRPALEVPPPPDRVVPQVPAPEPPLPSIEPVDDIPLGIKQSSPTKPKPPARQQEAPKQDAKPETPPATDPVPQPQPATPQLKLPENGDSGTLSRQIRDIVERTRRMLGVVTRANLPPIRQKNYDDAQSFVKQAEDALNAKNLVFAKEVAEKAERLAKDLQGR